MKLLFVIAAITLVFTSCVSNKLYRQSQMEAAALRQDSIRLAGRNTTLQNNIASLEANISSLKNNINDLNTRISNLSNQNIQLGQLTEEQKSQLTKSQQELYNQQQRLQQLQNILQQQREQSERDGKMCSPIDCTTFLPSSYSEPNFNKTKQRLGWETPPGSEYPDNTAGETLSVTGISRYFWSYKNQ